MVRVLIAGFCAVPGPARAGVQLGHVIRALARRGAVDVLAARRGEQPYVERAANVRLLRVPMPEGTLADRAEAFQRALRRQLDGADYDVVHVRDGWSASVVLEMRSRFGYAVVFDATRAPLADPSSVDEEEGRGLLEIEARCAREADLVLAPTEHGRRHLATIARPERVHLAPPGVDVNHFDWDLPARGGAPRVLYLGPIASGRGVRLLVQAMTEVSRRSEAVLALAGPADNAFLERTLASARALGIADRLEVPGEIPHDDVPDEIAKAAVCVAPRAPDTASAPVALFPTVLLEYMACRRPVVAARRSAAARLIRDGENGLLFAPGDPADLADRLSALLADADRREALAAAGYEDVRGGYTASGARRAIRWAYDALFDRPEWAEVFARAAAREQRTPRGGGEMPVVATEGVSRLGEDESETLADDITTVEPPAFAPHGADLDDDLAPPPRGEDTGDQLLAGDVGEDTGEDWVVEDSLTREHAVPDEPRAPGEAASGGESTPPIGSHFVAGELDVASALDRGDEHAPFAAAGPLLGGPTAPAPADQSDETDRSSAPGERRRSRRDTTAESGGDRD